MVRGVGMTTRSREQKIEAIITFALEDLAAWHAPTPIDGIGPAFPGVLEAFAAELKDLRRDLTEVLTQLPDERLDREFPDTTVPDRNPLFGINGPFGSLARRLAKAKKHVPADYVGGWAIEEKKSDLVYWRGYETIELADLALLCVGRDPRKTTYDALFQVYGRSDEGDELLYFLEDLYEVIANGLRMDPGKPHALVDVDGFGDWVTSKSPRIDPRLRRVLNERKKRTRKGAPSPEETPTQTEGALHKASLDAHARIVTAMAIAKYDLRADGYLGKVAQKIVDDGDFAGIGLSKSLVRKLLRLGLAQQDRTT